MVDWFLYTGINGKERTLYILLQLKSSLTPTGTGSHDQRLVRENCFHYCKVSYRMTISHLFDFVTKLASWKCTSITCATSGMCYARHVQIKPRNHTKSLHTHIATIWFWNRGQGENTTEIVRELSRGHSNICWVHHYNCQPSIDDLGTLLNEAVHQHSQQAGYL